MSVVLLNQPNPCGAVGETAPRLGNLAVGAQGPIAQDRAGERAPSLVRWAFFFSVAAIPFARLYIPGTGERLGVVRIEQFLLLCAVIAHPRACLRMLPTALLWFSGYVAIRTVSGLWLSRELWSTWWPITFEWVQLSLPWVWIAFNVLQFPELRRKGLWIFAWACALCALLHILGIGVSAVDSTSHEVRTTVFGENANVVGATYATAIIALIGLGMFKDVKPGQRLLIFPLVGILGLGMAKTGSRTAILLVAMGVFTLLFQAKAFSSRSRRYGTLIVIGVVLAGMVWQVPTVLERFRDLDPKDIGRENPRARMAPVLWEIFLRSPVYGSGPDQYQFELTRRAMPYLVRDQRTISAHNLVLLLLVETGIIGFFAFAGGIRQALASAWRARLGPAGLLPLALLLPFVLAGMVVSNPISDQVFWFAIAYALAGAA